MVVLMREQRGKNKSQAPIRQDWVANQRGDGREGRNRQAHMSSLGEQKTAVTLTKIGR